MGTPATTPIAAVAGIQARIAQAPGELGAFAVPGELAVLVESAVPEAPRVLAEAQVSAEQVPVVSRASPVP